MTEKERLEVLRNILNNGINMNFSQELILKISQKLDRHIVEYLKRNITVQNEGDEEGEKVS